MNCLTQVDRGFDLGYRASDGAEVWSAMSLRGQGRPAHVFGEFWEDGIIGN